MRPREACGHLLKVMVNELTDLPAGVLGFEIAGTLRSGDYSDVLVPAFERAAADGGIRCVLVIDDFGGFTPAALVHDLRTGVEHLRAWKRTALVTDIGWMAWTTTLLGWLAPGDVKRFSKAERKAAIAWAEAGQI